MSRRHVHAADALLLRIERQAQRLNARRRPASQIETTYIYALCEPDSDVIRYVGKANEPESRFWLHIHDSINANPFRTTPKEEWIRSLAAKRQQPTLKILEKVLRDEHPSAERRWIQWARDTGHDLTNVARVPG